jgi:hypothetical protein
MSGAAENALSTTIKCLCGAAGIGLGPTIKYLRCTASAAAGKGLGTKIKHLRGAAGIGLGTTIKYLRPQRGNGLGTTAKYLRRTTSGAAGNDLSRRRGLLMCLFTTTAPHSLFCACLRRQQAD